MKDFNSKHASVEVEQEAQCLVVTLKGFIPYQEMVNICQYEFQLIRQHQLKHCLVDLRAMGIYAPGVEDYIRNEWFAFVTKQEMRRIAFLVPENIFGKASMNKAHDKVSPSQGLQVEHFANLSLAKQWIRQEQPTHTLV